MSEQDLDTRIRALVARAVADAPAPPELDPATVARGSHRPRRGPAAAGGSAAAPPCSPRRRRSRPSCSSPTPTTASRTPTATTPPAVDDVAADRPATTVLDLDRADRTDGRRRPPSRRPPAATPREPSAGVATAGPDGVVLRDARRRPTVRRLDRAGVDRAARRRRPRRRRSSAAPTGVEDRRATHLVRRRHDVERVARRSSRQTARSPSQDVAVVGGRPAGAVPVLDRRSGRRRSRDAVRRRPATTASTSRGRVARGRRRLRVRPRPAAPGRPPGSIVGDVVRRVVVQPLRRRRCLGRPPASGRCPTPARARPRRVDSFVGDCGELPAAASRVDADGARRRLVRRRPTLVVTITRRARRAAAPDAAGVDAHGRPSTSTSRPTACSCSRLGDRARTAVRAGSARSTARALATHARPALRRRRRPPHDRDRRTPATPTPPATPTAPSGSSPPARRRRRAGGRRRGAAARPAGRGRLRARRGGAVHLPAGSRRAPRASRATR